MVRRDGYVKVLDFGIAKFTAPADAGADAEAATQRLFRTATGLVIGTASYMRPEQARGLRVDARTDVWSLGVVLYEMCAARLPFGGATSGDVLVSVLDREPPDLAQVSKGVPAELARVVAKALRKDREKRYANAEEFGRELKALQKRMESGELTAGEAQTAVLPSPERQGLAGAELPAHAETVTRVARSRAEEAPTEEARARSCSCSSPRRSCWQSASGPTRGVSRFPRRGRRPPRRRPRPPRPSAHSNIR